MSLPYFVGNKDDNNEMVVPNSKTSTIFLLPALFLLAHS